MRSYFQLILLLIFATVSDSWAVDVPAALQTSLTSSGTTTPASPDKTTGSSTQNTSSSFTIYVDNGTPDQNLYVDATNTIQASSKVIGCKAELTAPNVVTSSNPLGVGETKITTSGLVTFKFIDGDSAHTVVKFSVSKNVYDAKTIQSVVSDQTAKIAGGNVKISISCISAKAETSNLITQEVINQSSTAATTTPYTFTLTVKQADGGLNKVTTLVGNTDYPLTSSKTIESCDPKVTDSSGVVLQADSMMYVNVYQASGVNAYTLVIGKTDTAPDMVEIPSSMQLNMVCYSGETYDNLGVATRYQATISLPIQPADWVQSTASSTTGNTNTTKFVSPNPSGVSLTQNVSTTKPIVYNPSGSTTTQGSTTSTPSTPSGTGTTVVSTTNSSTTASSSTAAQTGSVFMRTTAVSGGFGDAGTTKRSASGTYPMNMKLDIQVSIGVQLADRGKAADAIIVIENEGGFYYIDTTGVWKVWNGDLNHLPIYSSSKKLSGNINITIHIGDLATGQYSVFAGYRTTDSNGTYITFNMLSPITATIVEADYAASSTSTTPSSNTDSGTSTAPSSSTGSGTSTAPSSSTGSGTSTTPSSSTGSGTSTAPSSSTGSGTSTAPSSSTGSGTSTAPSSSTGSGTSTTPSSSTGSSVPKVPANATGTSSTPFPLPIAW